MRGTRIVLGICSEPRGKELDSFLCPKKISRPVKESAVPVELFSLKLIFIKKGKRGVRMLFLRTEAYRLRRVPAQVLLSSSEYAQNYEIVFSGLPHQFNCITPDVNLTNPIASRYLVLHPRALNSQMQSPRRTNTISR